MFATWWWRASTIHRKGIGPAPSVNYFDISEILRIKSLASRGYITPHISELPEVRTALVGRVLSPQQLAAHFMIQSHHVGLDELLICQQQ